MAAITTVTTGCFWLGKSRRAETLPDGTFRLTLRLFDRQGSRRVESYLVTWSGPVAAAWWAENQTVQPGDGILVELINPRAMRDQGAIGPEIHATAVRLARASKQQEAQQQAADQSAARAAAENSQR